MKNKLINKIDDTILDAAANGDMGFIDSFLEAEGFDLGQISVRADKTFKQQSLYIKGIINRDKDTSLIEKALIRLKQVITENTNQTTDALKALLQAKTPSVQYRKLENWTDDEIRDVLADIDLISFLEELDKKND